MSSHCVTTCNISDNCMCDNNLNRLTIPKSGYSVLSYLEKLQVFFERFMMITEHNTFFLHK